ncbi:hypothetical protein B0I03_102412 [Flavobacterium aquaticum]|uniref:Group 1 truncated hemoglobin n=1 Tax=Flavobacterium aquaticum TaxID=1236486 RepID=A0A327YUD0_9FLAO|nr:MULTISPECIES: hypothetical protein [Flavobacterium]MCK6608321.1 hypothetical protein [Flavobacterium sp.]RAK24550.1 hypothetical protein B0I03_102412 [Flavobacterium aquaticum]
MKNFSKLALLALFIASGAFVTSCNDDDDQAPEPTSLYAKLGGTTMVADPNNPGQMIEQGRLSYRSVVDSTITLIVSDIVVGAEGNLGQHFAPVISEALSGNTTNVAILSDNLTDFFSANTGGGATNTYTGLNMVAAHDPAQNPRMGKKSNDAEYDKFIGYVGAAAGLNGVTDPVLIGEVVAVLESLRAPIVQE